VNTNYPTLFAKGVYYAIKLTNTGGAPDFCSVFVSGKLLWFGNVYAASPSYVYYRGEGYTENLQINQTTSTVNLYKIRTNHNQLWDGTGLTICYNPTLSRWVNTYSFRPETMGRVTSNLVTFKDGMPHVHDEEVNKAAYYGEPAVYAFATVTKEAGDQVKVAHKVSVEGNYPLDWVHIRSEKPYVQSTDVSSADYNLNPFLPGTAKKNEGMHYAPIRRDRRTPGTLSREMNLMKGDTMRGDYFLISGEDAYSRTYINAINIFYNISKGHQ
jgi:hypothetical protein